MSTLQVHPLAQPLSTWALLWVCILAACAGGIATQAEAAGPTWRVAGATGPTNLPPLTNEVQKLVVDAAGGTFVLSYEGQDTAPIPFDASPGQVEDALAMLSSLSAVNAITVSGGPGNPGGEIPYFVRFGGPLAGLDVDSLSANGAALTGVANSATVTLVTAGAPQGAGKVVAYVTNVSSSSEGLPITATIGPLPNGITTAAPGASGPHWSCSNGVGLTTVTCSRADPIPATSVADPIIVPLQISGAAAQSSVEIAVGGGGALQEGTYAQPMTVSMSPATAGIQTFWSGAFDEAGAPVTEAGAHPDVAMGLALNKTVLAPNGRVIPAGDLRDLDTRLPPGFIGNPLVTQRCPQSSLACDDADAVVGSLASGVGSFESGIGPADPPAMYNDVPPTGYPAAFTSKIGFPIQSFVGSLRSDEDYGVTVTAKNVLNYYKIYGALLKFDGQPAGSGGKPFLTNPMRCTGPAPVVTLDGNTWQEPSPFQALIDQQPAVTGCDALEFNPGFDFQPSASQAATGVAAVATVTVDQDGLVESDELATPHLKKSVVTLPEGVLLNPAAADGLRACSTKEIGLMGTGFPEPNPIRFDKSHPTCPDGSKIGTAELQTPLLEDTLAGTVYLAAQDDNPFKSLLAMYLVVDDDKTGTVVKLPGLVEPDAKTGQLTATFDNNPQLPFSSLKLNFRGGGPQSTLATPDVCGKYTTKGTFTPWSAPESGPPAQTEDSFNITTGVGGSASCPQTKAQRPFALGFEAGTTNPVAGGHSPFTLRITRPDGNQELNTINVDMPMGLTATLKGVQMCSDAALAAAGAAGRTGKAEMATPSCPVISQVGTTTIGAGVGPQPFYVKTGKVYLTGPYKGAPLGLAFIVPAVAGPFDLGVQVVRTALNVNPETAKITAVSDPIPQILEGIPLQIRDVRVDVDRPGFTLNPTSCEEMAVSGQVTGGSGAVANVGNRFQVGNCSALEFKPQLNLKLSGGTKRNAHPKFRAELKQPAGQANIGGVSVVLPPTQFIDNARIGNVCTRPQFAAEACPKSSILGNAVAYTPLLDEPLRGKVYFRANGGERELPDMVVDLKGQVPVVLVGFIDSVGKKGSEVSRIRNRFAVVPDAPVTKFVLNLKGGKQGLLVNSRDICAKKYKATVKLQGHNGKARNFNPVIKNDCGKKKNKKAKKSTKSPRANAPWYTQNFAD